MVAAKQAALSEDVADTVAHQIHTEVASDHAETLQERRVQRVHELMNDAAAFMREFHQDLLHSESTRNALENSVDACDARSEQLGRVVSKELRDLMADYMRVMQSMFVQFKQSASRFEKHLSGFSDTASTRLATEENRLQRVLELGKQFQRDELEKLAERSSLRNDDIRATENITSSSFRDAAEREHNELLARKAEMQDSFVAETEKLSLSHGNLRVKFTAENSKLQMHYKEMEKLKEQVKTFEELSASSKMKSEAFQKKNDLLFHIRDLKSKIQRESRAHEAKLLKLATAFENAKTKLEKEISLVEKILRINNQVKLLRPRPSSKFEHRGSLLDSLREETALLALEVGVMPIGS